MPIFLFECEKCGRKPEKMMTWKESEGFVPCVCGAYLKKVIAPSSFHLVGDCWARDGYSRAEVK